MNEFFKEMRNLYVPRDNPRWHEHFFDLFHYSLAAVVLAFTLIGSATVKFFRDEIEGWKKARRQDWTPKKVDWSRAITLTAMFMLLMPFCLVTGNSLSDLRKVLSGQ